MVYLVKKRPFWCRGDPEIGDGRLLLEMLLNFLIPTSLQTSGSATTIIGCLPIWNLRQIELLVHGIVVHDATINHGRRAIYRPEDWAIGLRENTKDIWSMLCKQGEVADERDCRRPWHFPYSPIRCVEVHEEANQ